MKFFSCCIICIFILACSKDKVVIDPANRLVGNWTWVGSTGVPTGQQHPSSESYQELRFPNTSEFQWLQNGEVLYNSNYSFTSINSSFWKLKSPAFGVNYYDVQIIQDTLILYVPNNYAISHTFKKQ